MERKTTLFLINDETDDAAISLWAEAAAKDETHLACMLLGITPALPVYAYGVSPMGGVAMPENWNSVMEDARNSQMARVQEIEALLSKHGAPGSVQSILAAASDLRHHIAKSARVADVAAVAPNLHQTPDLFKEAAYGVLFESPVGLVINATAGQAAKRIFIAWDSSQPAAKAVHAALADLVKADEVIIACFDPAANRFQDGADPGTDIAAWLSHHGCKVTVSQYPSGGHAISRCIQDRAREQGADLVVMGAYGHARMIQTVFGGTTKAMMNQTDLAVLLAH